MVSSVVTMVTRELFVVTKVVVMVAKTVAIGIVVTGAIAGEMLIGY